MSSNDVAVSVRGLGKSYTIAHNKVHHTTLGETILHRIRHPFQNVQLETFWALKDLSFDIKRGDVVGIVGRNGAGKSTLLKVLSRITEPTLGEVQMNGRVASLLEVGTGFHPELTGRENIYLNGQILGMRKKEIDKQFDAIVDFSECEQFLDTPVKRYSSGMYVRLAFSVAAHLSAEILIVDEVLAVGDAQFQKKCLGKMKEVAQGGKITVLFVSHNMGAISSLCNSGVLISKGKVFATGSIDKVIAAYVDPNSGHYSAVKFFNLLRDDGSIKFKNIEARQRDLTTSIIDCRTPFEVDIDFEIVRPVPKSRMFVIFRNAMGDVIFTTSEMDTRQGIFPTRHSGQYRATIQIPPALLKVGTIYCTVSCDVKAERVLMVAEDVLRLDIVDEDPETESERHVREGAVAPIFSWAVQPQERETINLPGQPEAVTPI